MTKVFKLQTAFTAGEVSPRIYSRVDLAQFTTGLETCFNFIVLPYGGVYRRPGTKYVTGNKSNSAVSKLMRFEYSNEQAYVLEFSDTRLRFFTQQGKVLQSRGITNGDFTSGISGWSNSSSGTGSISHDAGNLRLALNGGGAGNEARAIYSTNLTYIGTSAYTLTLDVYSASVTVKIGTSSGGTQIATSTVTTGTAKTVAFTPAANYAQIYITLESSGTATVDNVSLTNPVYEIDTEYLTAGLSDIRSAQSFDTMYIVDGTNPPKQLIRYTSDKWVLSDFTFDEPPYLDMNGTTTTFTPSGTSGSITITASASTFASTDVGRAIRYLAGPDSTDATVYTGTGTQTNFDIPFYPQGTSDVEVYLVAATGVRTLQTVPANYSITDGQVDMVSAPSTSEKLLIQRKNTGSGKWGWATITGYTSATQVSATVEREFGGTNASVYWRLGAFSDTTGYPKTVCLHEGRLWFGNTDTQPQTFWASEVGVYNNFQPDNSLLKGDVDDSTSFTFTLGANKSQSIAWMGSKGNAILIGTSNGVYSVRPSASGAISATNITARKEIDIPCAQLDIAETFNQIIFIERLKKRIYSLTYSFDIDSFRPQELTLLSEHLGQVYTFEEVAYQDIPSKVLWVRRSDGKLLSCTYVPDQNVIGWGRHAIAGTDTEVESICTITGENFSELWMSVKRTIDSSTKRYIEYLTEEFFNDDKEDATFADSCLQYDGSSTTTITGLGHLEGQTVTVLGDGAVQSDKTVTSGSVTITSSSKATIGLGYTSELRSLNVEAGSMGGTGQGQLSRIFECTVRFFETLGGKVGYNNSTTETLQYRSAGGLMDTSSDIYSGYKTLKFPHGYEQDIKVYVSQSQPLPMTLLGIVYKANISDN